MKNKITCTTHLVNGTDIQVCNEDSPNQAIEKWLMPDMRPPVQVLAITLWDDKGDEYKLSITQSDIVIRRIS